jgi:ribosomal protein L44E
MSSPYEHELYCPKCREYYLEMVEYVKVDKQCFIKKAESDILSFKKIGEIK